MPMSPEQFVPLLIETGTKAEALAGEHFANNDDLLIHLLLPAVLRLCVREFHDGNCEASAQLLTLVHDAWRDGDERLRNAVAVSFVEHAGQGEGETAEFLSTWPTGLLELDES